MDDLKGDLTPNSIEGFIRLSTSDMVRDKARRTVPVLDASAVTSPMPLSGIGLYYNSAKDHAGFISLQLHSLRYIEYLKQAIRAYKPSNVLENHE